MIILNILLIAFFLCFFFLLRVKAVEKLTPEVFGAPEKLLDEAKVKLNQMTTILNTTDTNFISTVLFKERMNEVEKLMAEVEEIHLKVKFLNSKLRGFKVYHLIFVDINTWTKEQLLEKWEEERLAKV